MASYGGLSREHQMTPAHRITAADSETGGKTYKGAKADREDMSRMNKSQELRRSFRFVGLFGFALLLGGGWQVLSRRSDPTHDRY